MDSANARSDAASSGGGRPLGPSQKDGGHRSGVRRVRVAQRLLYAVWVGSYREPEHADRLHQLPVRQPSVGQREEGIKKPNYGGGRRLFFGTTDTQQPTQKQRSSMPQKKEKTRTTEKKRSVKVHDLAAKKDAKGGGFKVPATPRVAQ